jgi:tetratricopeptide (TPR) repeat protein
MTNSLVKLTQESDYQGRYQRTIEFHEQRLRIAIERGDHAGEAACLNNLGMAYHSLGQYEEAIDYYGHSLEIERQLGASEAGRDREHRSRASRVWGNLAMFTIPSGNTRRRLSSISSPWQLNGNSTTLED